MSQPVICVICGQQKRQKMNKDIDKKFICALEMLESQEGSLRSAASYLNVSPSMYSGWKKNEGGELSMKVRERIGAKMQPFLDSIIIGNENTINELERFSEETDDSFIMASLAHELGELKSLIPEKILNSTGKKREQIKKILNNLSELL